MTEPSESQMSSSIRTHLRSNVVGYVAVFLALSGGAYAAGLKANSVRSKQIKDGQVKNPDLGAGSVTSDKVAPDSLTGGQIDESSLAQVPSAASADAATNAGQLGGQAPSAFQRRVTGTCTGTQAIKSVGTDGTVTCGSAGGSGTVTQVSTGTGLSGGPITTTGTIDLAAAYRLPQGCTSGQVAKSNGSNVWACANDSTAPTGTAGGDLSGTYPSPTIAANAVNSAKVADNTLTGTDIDESTLDAAVVQKRVTGTCTPHSAVQSVAQAGSVTCEAFGSRLWVKVAADGTQLAGAGVASVSKFGTGRYAITFNQDVGSCGIIATVNMTSASDPGIGSGSAIAGATGTGVFVRTATPSGAGTTNVDDDRPFTLAAMC